MRGWLRIPLALAALTILTTPAEGQTVSMTLESDALRSVEGTIPVMSVEWSVANPSAMSTGGGAGSGTASFSTVRIQKRVDAASPQLFLNAAQGARLEEVTLHFMDDGKRLEVQTILLRNVVVTSVQQSTDGGVLTEVVELAFGEIRMTVLDGRQSFEASWNVRENRGG